MLKSQLALTLNIIFQFCQSWLSDGLGDYIKNQPQENYCLFINFVRFFFPAAYNYERKLCYVCCLITGKYTVTKQRLMHFISSKYKTPRKQSTIMVHIFEVVDRLGSQ